MYFHNPETEELYFVAEGRFETTQACLLQQGIDLTKCTPVDAEFVKAFEARVWSTIPEESPHATTDPTA